MPRASQVHYYEYRKGYFTKIKGKQHALAMGPKDDPDGPVYKRAVEEFSRLIQCADQKAEDNASVSMILTRYYFSLEKEKRDKTLAVVKDMLDPAILEIGSVRCSQLKPYHVSDFLDKQTTWNDNTRHTAISKLTGAFNWAVAQGYLTRNPIPKIKKPEAKARGEKVVVPEELERLLIEKANKGFSRFLRFLSGTGCRPGEAMHAEVHHYKKDLRAIIFPWNPPEGEYRWKNAKKSKKDRVIYLTDEMVTLVEGELAGRSSGPILRSNTGINFKPLNVRSTLKRLLGKKGVKEWVARNKYQSSQLMPYSFRHSYATRMLKQGCPIKLLADAMGTSVRMIERHYSHAHDDHASMRRLLISFASPSPGPSSGGSNP